MEKFGQRGRLVKSATLMERKTDTPLKIKISPENQCLEDDLFSFKMDPFLRGRIREHFQGCFFPFSI